MSAVLVYCKWTLNQDDDDDDDDSMKMTGNFTSDFLEIGKPQKLLIHWKHSARQK